MLFVRRTAPEGSYFEDGDRASGVFGVLATGFAIFAGSSSSSLSRVMTSPGAARSLRPSCSFSSSRPPSSCRPRPPPPGGRADLYGRSVVSQEWPRMEDGTAGDAINQAVLFTSLKLAKPQTSTEDAAYSKWLDQDLGSRGERAATEYTVPPASSPTRSGSSSSSRRASSSRSCSFRWTAPSVPSRRPCSSARRQQSSLRRCSRSTRSITLPARCRESAAGGHGAVARPPGQSAGRRERHRPSPVR